MKTSKIRKFFEIVRLILLAYVMCISVSARASSCSGTPGSVLLNLPATVSVPRNATVGSIITAWVSSPATTNYWSCSVDSAGYGARSTMGSVAQASTGMSISDSAGDGPFTIWSTNVPGVGIAVGTRVYYNAGTGCSGGIAWQGWTTPPSGSWAGTVCPTINNSFSGTYGSQVTVALVVTGPVTAGGTISGVVAQGAPVFNGVTTTSQAVSYTLAGTTIVPMTCTTPDVNVPMGTFKTTDFPSVGSLSPNPAGFTIQLTNCPAGAAVSGTQAGVIHSIGYRIDPTNGTLATNVAALSGGSPSASGVGIELFDNTGAVFPLSTTKTMNSSNSTSTGDYSGGGNYSIPMTARYYRTGTVTPGPANATMTLTMSYQ
jgi:major type 1 subunit fimbrin (pilin)